MVPMGYGALSWKSKTYLNSTKNKKVKVSAYVIKI